MQILFWGTRGSIPAPGKDTVEFGGNTSCVEVVLSSGISLIMDAGSGIRLLGIDYLSRKDAPRELHLFISHAHWDHIQGFPYFIPAFLADFTVHIYSHLDAKDVLTRQMSEPFFPVPISMLQAKLEFHLLGKEPVEIAGATISFLTLNHPQEAYGFRIDDGGASMVYSTDTEHEESGSDKALIEFSKGAGALLYDAQYTPEEYSSGRVGWGHSTYEAAADIAKKAGVKKLVLVHHEPTHNDDSVRAIEAKAKELFPGAMAAREGQALDIS